MFPSDLLSVRHTQMLHSHFHTTEYFNSSDNMLHFRSEDTTQVTICFTSVQKIHSSSLS